MSEQNSTNTRPGSEEGLKKILSGDPLKNATDFIAYMQANDVTDNSEGGFSYLGECFCVMVTFDEAFGKNWIHAFPFSSSTATMFVNPQISMWMKN